MNGFTDKQMSEMEKIEVIELALDEFHDMSCIKHFPGLKALSLVNVNLAKIDVPPQLADS